MGFVFVRGLGEGRDSAAKGARRKVSLYPVDKFG